MALGWAIELATGGENESMVWNDVLETEPQNSSVQDVQAEVWLHLRIAFDDLTPAIYDASVAEAGAERPALAEVPTWWSLRARGGQKRDTD
jgi:hypothetical protein